jgi:hypothetical protein
MEWMVFGVSVDEREKDLDLHSSESEIVKCREGNCGFGNLDLAPKFEGWVGTESKTGRRCWACMCLLC